MALLCRGFMNRVHFCSPLDGIDCKASTIFPGSGEKTDTIFLWKHQISITNRSSSSLLVSLDSTPSCFLIPSKLLFLRVFKEAAGISVGSPGLEGMASSFTEPTILFLDIFTLSGPTRGQGTSPSLHPHCPQKENMTCVSLPLGVELAEPGPTKLVFQMNFFQWTWCNWTWNSLPRWRLPWQRFGDTPSAIVFLSGELCVRNLSLFTLAVVLLFHTVNSQGCVACSCPQGEGRRQLQGSKVMAWERIPLDTKVEGSWASEKRNSMVWGLLRCAAEEGSRWVSNDPMSRLLLRWKSVISPKESDGRDKPDPTAVIRGQPAPCSPSRWNLLQQSAKESKWREKRLIVTKKPVIREMWSSMRTRSQVLILYYCEPQCNVLLSFH